MNRRQLARTIPILALAATLFSRWAAARPAITRYYGVQNHTSLTTRCQAKWYSIGASNLKQLTIFGTKCGADSAPWVAVYSTAFEPIDAHHTRPEADATLLHIMQQGAIRSAMRFTGPKVTWRMRTAAKKGWRNGVPVHYQVAVFYAKKGILVTVDSFVDDTSPRLVYGTSVTTAVFFTNTAAAKKAEAYALRLISSIAIVRPATALGDLGAEDLTRASPADRACFARATKDGQRIQSFMSSNDRSDALTQVESTAKQWQQCAQHAITYFDDLLAAYHVLSTMWIGDSLIAHGVTHDAKLCSVMQTAEHHAQAHSFRYIASKVQRFMHRHC